MKTYCLLTPIVLSFNRGQEQSDELLASSDGITLEADENTIWAVKDGVRHESITTSNAIETWLDSNQIEEV